MSANAKATSALEALDRAIAELEEVRPDPVEQERLRKLTVLGLLRARGITVPNADALTSAALEEELKRHSPHLYPPPVA
jgi:hypothetical protein